jgi:hypothetical protein
VRPLVGALASLFALGACTSVGSHQKFTQAEADAISVQCGGSPGWLRVTGGKVMIEFPIDAPYEATKCVLQGMKAAGLTEFGFIGNEAAPD